MNPLNGLINLFRKKPTASTEADGKWMQGCLAFEAGKKHFAEGHYQEAVDWLDLAVERGFENGALFSLRGSCLQSLGWHLDAIDDFTKVISLEPQDCNHYFQRACSKNSIGDQTAYADIQDAVRLAKPDNELTRIYNLGAKDMGWQSAAAMYSRSSSQESKLLGGLLAEQAKLRGRRK